MPLPRHSATLAFQPQLQELFLMGGTLCDDNHGLNTDLWTFDGSNWTERTDDDDSVWPVVTFYAAVTDTTRQHLVLFEGQPLGVGEDFISLHSSLDSGRFDNLWVGLDYQAPEVSYGHALVSLRGDTNEDIQVMGFGGFNVHMDGEGANGPVNTTYLFNGDGWQEYEQEHVCANEFFCPIIARQNHAMSGASDTGVILFGGESEHKTMLGDTWVYESGTWYPQEMLVEPPPIADPPFARKGHAMAGYSSSHFLFGGKTNDNDDCGSFGARDDEGFCYTNDLWGFNLLGDYQWTEIDSGSWFIAPNLNTPVGRAEHALAVFDNITSGPTIVLFGGYIGGHFPYPCTDANEAMDSQGDCYLGDTWVYTSSHGWRKDDSHNEMPSPRAGHQMVYDESHQRILLFGGQMGGTFYGDTWMYDFNDNTWIKLMGQDASGLTAPLPRSAHAMGVVLARDNAWVMVHGGQTEEASLVDSWLFQTGGEEKPALQMEIQFQEAGGPGSQLTHINGVEVVGAVGADGFAPPEAPGGDIVQSRDATISVWQGSHFQPITEVIDADIAAPSSFVHQIREETILNRAFHGSQKSLYLKVEPTYSLGNNITATGLATEYLEVRVKYQHRLMEETEEMDGGVPEDSDGDL